MNAELITVLALTGVFVSALTFLYWSSLSSIKAAHQQQVESLRADQKTLHALLKEANNRIQAKSLTDFLTLQAHNEGTRAVEIPQGMVMSRTDAEEAEIAANRMEASSPIGGGY